MHIRTVAGLLLDSGEGFACQRARGSSQGPAIVTLKQAMGKMGVQKRSRKISGVEVTSALHILAVPNGLLRPLNAVRAMHLQVRCL